MNVSLVDLRPETPAWWLYSDMRKLNYSQPVWCLGILTLHHVIVMALQIVGNSSGSATVNLSMMTSSDENIFRVTGHLCKEFTGPW